MKDKLAFPLNELDQITGQIFAQHFGMTLRDYFAAKAMQSYVAHNKSYDFDDIAAVSYRTADAMLKAREA